MHLCVCKRKPNAKLQVHAKKITSTCEKKRKQQQQYKMCQQAVLIKPQACIYANQPGFRNRIGGAGISDMAVGPPQNKKEEKACRACVKTKTSKLVMQRNENKNKTYKTCHTKITPTVQIKMSAPDRKNAKEGMGCASVCVPVQASDGSRLVVCVKCAHVYVLTKTSKLLWVQFFCA